MTSQLKHIEQIEEGLWDKFKDQVLGAPEERTAVKQQFKQGIDAVKRKLTKPASAPEKIKDTGEEKFAWVANLTPEQKQELIIQIKKMLHTGGRQKGQELSQDPNAVKQRKKRAIGKVVKSAAGEPFTWKGAQWISNTTGKIATTDVAAELSKQAGLAEDVYDYEVFKNKLIEVLTAK